MSTTSRGPSRRTLVKGAAWSVPVVAVAGAAPAWAASGDPIDPSFQPGTFCKHSSDNAYHAVFCFNNTTDADITVRFTRMDVAGTNGSTNIAPASFTVPAGASPCIYVDGIGFNSMPEATATLHFEYDYNGGTVRGSIDTSADGNQQVTPCGTNPREDQPKDKPPHDPGYPNPARERARNAAANDAESDESADVKGDEAPVNVESAGTEAVETEAPAPLESAEPAPAPADDASATSAP